MQVSTCVCRVDMHSAGQSRQAQTYKSANEHVVLICTKRDHTAKCKSVVMWCIKSVVSLHSQCLNCTIVTLCRFNLQFFWTAFVRVQKNACLLDLQQRSAVPPCAMMDGILLLARRVESVEGVHHVVVQCSCRTRGCSLVCCGGIGVHGVWLCCVVACTLPAE